MSRRSVHRTTVAILLEKEGPATTRGVAERTGMGMLSAAELIHRMRRAGEVRIIGYAVNPAYRASRDAPRWVHVWGLAPSTIPEADLFHPSDSSSASHVRHGWSVPDRHACCTAEDAA